MTESSFLFYFNWESSSTHKAEDLKTHNLGVCQFIEIYLFFRIITDVKMFSNIIVKTVLFKVLSAENIQKCSVNKTKKYANIFYAFWDKSTLQVLYYYNISIFFFNFITFLLHMMAGLYLLVFHSSLWSTAPSSGTFLISSITDSDYKILLSSMDFIVFIQLILGMIPSVCNSLGLISLGEFYIVESSITS